MVNQWYTLIMNQPAADLVSVPWRRYVTSAFIPKRYNTVQARIRAAILGTRSDIWEQAYNLDAVIRLVDDSRYLQWASDPHTTPAVINPSDFDFDETLTAMNTEAEDAYGGYIFTKVAPTVPLRRSWRIRVTADAYAVTDLISGGSRYVSLENCVLDDDVKLVTAKEPALGAEWILTLYAQPLNVISGVIARLADRSAEVEELTATSHYPMPFYRKLATSTNVADMLAGVLLAFDLSTRI